MTSRGPADYRRGTVYALATAILLAVQEPFSALAAKNLSATDFLGFTQCALLLSVPLLIMRGDRRRDFVTILFDVRNWPKLAVVFCVGVIGLALYDIGLSSAHPIITAAILNLSPFWAALVAFVVTRRPISIPPIVFFACFLLAFCGAMAIARSQIDLENATLERDVLESAMHSKWIYAIPMPIFFALSGTLVFKWFSEFEEQAIIAANFVVSSLVLIPVAVVMSDFGRRTHLHRAVDSGNLVAARGNPGGVGRGACLLSIGLDRDSKRQRLCDDVFLVDTGVILADLVPAVAVDHGLAVHFRPSVLHRHDAGNGPAPSDIAVDVAGAPGRRPVMRYRVRADSDQPVSYPQALK